MYLINLFILTFVVATVTYALPDDTQRVMHIVANSSQFNYKTGESIYEGDVKIDQGSTHLTADRVITHNNQQHKIEETIAYGLKKFAVYTTIPKENDLILKATAHVIKFYPQKSTVIFANEVTVQQGENSFNGPIIIYNIKDQLVTAPASQGGRATIIIKPT